MALRCELYDRDCIDCNDCEFCDLDNTKKCDNCGKCLDEVSEIRTLNIDEFIQELDDKERFEKRRG